MFLKHIIYAPYAVVRNIYYKQFEKYQSSSETGLNHKLSDIKHSLETAVNSSNDRLTQMEIFSYL